ncbi:MAG: hypothetical protein FWD15_00240 [Alphaproteobacteria bacterium]|nr:hypothetical protein [Alphaproteobacteria bacterium]
MKRILILLTAISLGACQMPERGAEMGTGTGTGDLPHTFAEFQDIPIPERARMLLDHTAIYGRSNEWVGKITYTVPFGVSGVYDFYISEMPRFGWDEITSIRGSHSAMTFIQGRRVAMIQISASSASGTIVVINMSPLPPKVSVITTPGQSRAPNQPMSAVPTTLAPASATFPTVGSAPASRLSPTPDEATAAMGVGPGTVYGNVNTDADAHRVAPGALGLGDASNMNFPSASRGVGAPPVF